MEKLFYVYILTNWNHSVLYVGVTSDLIKRVYQHKNKLFDGFTKYYNVTKLVWYEIYHDSISAIQREKEIKKWRREKKIQIIKKNNDQWRDLYTEITG